MKWLEVHKHFAITIACIVGLLVGLYVYDAHQERMAEKQQAINDKLLPQLTSKIEKNNSDLSDFKIAILQEISSIKTAKQGLTILQPTIPGAAPQAITKGDLPANIQSQLPANTTADTRFNLFTDEQVIALAKNADQCKIDAAGLSTCQANQVIMQQKIDSLLKANQQWEDYGTVPRWTFQLGVSKNALGNYKPAGLINFRVQHNWGIGFGAVNNALVGTVNINFGSKPQVKP